MNKFKTPILILLLILVSTTQALASGSTSITDGAGNGVDVTAGALDVKVDVALPAGTNNIGDVDVDSLPAAGVIDTSANGTGVIAFIELAADKSEQMYYGDRGLAVASGVCADILTGSVSMVIYTVAEAAP